MGPGPSCVPAEVYQALSRPTIGHLDPRFISIMDEIKGLLQEVIQTSNSLTLPISGTGSSGMESVELGGGDGGGEGGGDGSQDCQGPGYGGGFGGGGDQCGQGDGSGSVGEYPGDGASSEELGAELDKSLGEFDESIGEEQREIASTTRNTEGFDTGSGGNRGGSISLGEQAAGAMASSGASGGGGSGSGSDAIGQVDRSGALDGLDSEEIARRTPDDLEAFEATDDVVAKQIREAALAEEDPERREQMWEQYRRYKGIEGN
jgi:hypothetical protein